LYVFKLYVYHLFCETVDERVASVALELMDLLASLSLILRLWSWVMWWIPLFKEKCLKCQFRT